MSLASWSKDKILDHEKVLDVNLIDSSMLNVSHENGSEFKIAVISSERVNLDSLRNINIADIDFILNIKKDAYITGDVFDLGDSAGFSIGTLGDVYRALNNGFMANYLDAEMSFVIRGLGQHRKVTELKRLDNRRFLISRDSLPSVTILVLNDYDFTAEAVRHGIDVFGEFDAILTSNPNCRRTGNCMGAASSAGIKIMDWGELMGNLNRRWN
jgi:hypothetical protein